MELGILALLMGVGLLTAFSSGSDDVEAEEKRPEPPDVEAPPLINVGTDGNDTVRVQDENPTINATLGDGDDRGYAFVTSGTFLSGGQGDDILSGSTRSTLFGNAGNDELGISSFFGADVGQTEFDSAAYGGDGNDKLFSDRGHVEEGTVSLFGEAGQDFLHVRNEAGAIERGGITKILSGGDGDDTFRVELIFPRFDPDAPEFEPHTSEDTNVFITDFTPGTERLTITASGSPTNPILETAALSRDEDGLTTLNMTFAPVGDAPAASTSIALGYADGITLDDINLPGEVERGEELSYLGYQDIFGAGGNDTLIATDDDIPDSLRVELGGGDDFAYVRSNGARISGDEGDDVFRTSDVAETIYGGPGDDYFSEAANRNTGPDALFGGEGNDTIAVIGSRDIEYRASDDQTYRILEPNVVNGGLGDDVIVSSHNNILTGGEGRDTFGIVNNNFNNYTAPLITDFDRTQDALFIDYRDEQDLPNLPDDLVISAWEDGTGADVFFGETLMVRVGGGQNLVPTDIRIPDDSVYTDLLERT
ncbi:hypothetical protein [uncultured Sulfitobacter sp.]|uniref:hypothetical protein n=1 Tax=uncultured Sulfitobacter sp. TaxID=191468 RepID=UPI002623ED37|nr:hypothetical protein [uncultured Sulfitobacter sp.]